MKPFSIRQRRRGILILLAILLVALSFWLFHRPPPPSPAIIVFPLPYQIPHTKVPLPDRWIPRSWGWMWRLKEAVLGRAKPIALGSTVFEVAGQDETAL